MVTLCDGEGGDRESGCRSRAKTNAGEISCDRMFHIDESNQYSQREVDKKRRTLAPRWTRTLAR